MADAGRVWVEWRAPNLAPELRRGTLGLAVRVSCARFWLMSRIARKETSFTSARGSPSDHEPPETAAASVREARGPLELLAPFADARSGEAPTALLLMLDAFRMLLTSYYILKPVREALILAGEGAEVKSYAAAGPGSDSPGVRPAYGALAARVRRIRLITGVTLSSSPVWSPSTWWRTHGSHLGLIFYIWIGIFNRGRSSPSSGRTRTISRPRRASACSRSSRSAPTFGAIVGASITRC